MFNLSPTCRSGLTRGSTKRQQSLVTTASAPEQDLQQEANKTSRRFSSQRFPAGPNIVKTQIAYSSL
jgi:hypothetical protein